MLCLDNIDTTFFIFSDAVPSVLYYSHLPTMFVALFLGFFVYFRSGRNLLGKVLLSISFSFSLWTLINLIIWTNSNSEWIIFLWSILGFLYIFICLSVLYFFCVYLDKQDINLIKKLIFLLIILPSIVLIPTSLDLTSFDLTNCEAVENTSFNNYYYGVGFLIFIWIFFLSFFRYWKSDRFARKEILILTVGVELFLLSFFTTGYLASFLNNFELEQYGLFGMTFFMGVLAYMIVKFQAFNIKLIGTQALVFSLFILIASQFAFIQNPINRALTGITLILLTIFGYSLINSVKREVRQRDALAVANREISERKEELQKISDHLSEANAKLKELDNAKTEFVSIVAHQLQSPPTTIKGYSKLLEEGSYGELSSEQKDVIKKIYNANEQQVEFVADLLSVSRLESGRVSFNFESCQVQDICQEVVDNLFIKAKEKGLYLEFKKPEKILPEIKIDRAKIRESITNLVDNAIKYTKRGGVVVSLKNCSLGEDKCLSVNHLRIKVSDTGIGIPADEIPRLFSKFSRGKDVKRLNAGGTGLGLYVVKMIVEGNRGKVWVESDGDGRGSKFIIELPFS